jgi:hypothetical protein
MRTEQPQSIKRMKLIPVKDSEENFKRTKPKVPFASDFIGTSTHLQAHTYYLFIEVRKYTQTHTYTYTRNYAHLSLTV